MKLFNCSDKARCSFSIKFEQFSFDYLNDREKNSFVRWTSFTFQIELDRFHSMLMFHTVEVHRTNLKRTKTMSENQISRVFSSTERFIWIFSICSDENIDASRKSKVFSWKTSVDRFDFDTFSRRARITKLVSFFADKKFVNQSIDFMITDETFDYSNYFYDKHNIKFLIDLSRKRITEKCQNRIQSISLFTRCHLLNKTFFISKLSNFKRQNQTDSSCKIINSKRWTTIGRWE